MNAAGLAPPQVAAVRQAVLDAPGGAGAVERG